jgi:hypothetical protein
MLGEKHSLVVFEIMTLRIISGVNGAKQQGNEKGYRTGNFMTCSNQTGMNEIIAACSIYGKKRGTDRVLMGIPQEEIPLGRRRCI